MDRNAKRTATVATNSGGGGSHSRVSAAAAGSLLTSSNGERGGAGNNQASSVGLDKEISNSIGRGAKQPSRNSSQQDQPHHSVSGATSVKNRSSGGISVINKVEEGEAFLFVLNLLIDMTDRNYTHVSVFNIYLLPSVMVLCCMRVYASCIYRSHR